MADIQEAKLEDSFAAAEQAKQASKELLNTTKKYKDSLEASTDTATLLSDQLKDIYSSDWIRESPHIDVAKYLRYLGTTFNAVNSVNSQMVKSMDKAIIEPLQNFSNYDFLEMVDARKKVSTTASDYEGMRQKIEGALAPKKGRRKKDPFDPAQLLQYENELERLRADQEQNQKHLSTVLDQTHQKKETKLLKLMLELLELQYDYHEKAFKLLTNLRPKMTDLRSQLDESCKESADVKEGHLNMKSTGTMTGNSGWQKYWFVIKDGMLNCYNFKGKRDAAFEPLNIMYTTTRIPPKAPKGQFVFEIVTPDKRKPLVLLADSAESRDAWVKHIQDAIETQLNQNEPAVSITENETLVQKILSAVPGNRFCADCGCPDPDWASINLGILVCLDCSGVHRNLGTHITKVRSTTLDTKAWEPYLVMYMKSMGNYNFNQIYEANLDPVGYPRPSFEAPSDTERPAREKFIKAKYSERKFVEPTTLHPHELAAKMYALIATSDDVIEPFKLLAQGADVSWQNSEDEMKTVTHCAVIFDKLSCLEMLIQNGSDIFCKETRDWSPMHYAAYYHRVACAVVLHKHGFSGQQQLECKDWQNKTAIELALIGGCEDIVSLLNGEKKIGVGFTIEDLEVPDSVTPPPIPDSIPPIPESTTTASIAAESVPVEYEEVPVVDSTPQGQVQNTEMLKRQLAQNLVNAKAPAPLASASNVPIPAPIASDANNFLASNAPLPSTPSKRPVVPVSRGRGRGRGGSTPTSQRHHTVTSAPPSIPPKPKF